MEMMRIEATETWNHFDPNHSMETIYPGRIIALPIAYAKAIIRLEWGREA